MCAQYAAEHDPIEAGRIFTFEALEASYRECRKRKRGTRNALRFEVDLENNLLMLLTELQTGVYRPCRSVCFLSKNPKIREIIAADFRDRIVHHFLVGRLEPVFEKRFIHDSYASRKGKGTHAAVDRLDCFLRKATRNHTCRCWYAHLDIRNFFMTIDRGILYRLVARRIPFSSTLRWLAYILIFNDPTKNAVWKGSRAERVRIPPGKSLFGAPPGKGLPIGNHTSQFFANVYLNELDQFVKRMLKAAFYIRYVDDMVILDTSRDKLLQWKKGIASFLESRLDLKLNERRSKIAPVGSGINFLGYVSHPRHRLLRRRVTGNLVKKLENLSHCLATERRGYSWILYLPETSRYLEAMLASYDAMLNRGNCFRLKRKIAGQFPFLAGICYRRGQKPFWKIQSSFPRFYSQVHRFHEEFDGALIAIQAGRFFEFHGPQAEWASRFMGLKVFHSRRGGFNTWCRLPVDRSGTLIDTAKQSAVRTIVMVNQEAPPLTGDVCQRRAVAIGYINET